MISVQEFIDEGFDQSEYPQQSRARLRVFGKEKREYCITRIRKQCGYESEILDHAPDICLTCSKFETMEIFLPLDTSKETEE